MTRPTGAAHPRWNPERMLSSHGYVKVRVGKEHPLADSKGMAYEHLLVWLASGRPMPRADETLHHRSGDKRDNRIQNLACITRSAHAKLHAAERRRHTNGTFARRAA